MSQELLNRIENAEKELKLVKEELEKSKVSKVEFYNNQLVLVRNTLGEAPLRRFFSHIVKANVPFACYDYGHTSLRENSSVVFWKYCEPDYEADSLLNWIPNTTGKRPEGVTKCLMRVRGATLDRIIPWNYSWKLTDWTPITSYCILERE